MVKKDNVFSAGIMSSESGVRSQVFHPALNLDLLQLVAVRLLILWVADNWRPVASINSQDKPYGITCDDQHIRRTPSTQVGTSSI